MTTIVLCNRIGSVEYKDKRKNHSGEDKYIQYHAKATSLVFSGPPLPHVLSSHLRGG